MRKGANALGLSVDFLYLSCHCVSLTFRETVSSMTVRMSSERGFIRILYTGELNYVTSCMARVLSIPQGHGVNCMLGSMATVFTWPLSCLPGNVVFIRQNNTLDTTSSKKLCLNHSFPEKVTNFYLRVLRTQLWQHVVHGY